VFNKVAKNKDYFIGKWEDQMKGKDILIKVIAKRFIGTFKTSNPLTTLT